MSLDSSEQLVVRAERAADRTRRTAVFMACVVAVQVIAVAVQVVVVVTR